MMQEIRAGLISMRLRSSSQRSIVFGLLCTGAEWMMLMSGSLSVSADSYQPQPEPNPSVRHFLPLFPVQLTKEDSCVFNMNFSGSSGNS